MQRRITWIGKGLCKELTSVSCRPAARGPERQPKMEGGEEL